MVSDYEYLVEQREIIFKAKEVIFGRREVKTAAEEMISGDTDAIGKFLQQNKKNGKNGDGG